MEGPLVENGTQAQTQSPTAAAQVRFTIPQEYPPGQSVAVQRCSLSPVLRDDFADFGIFSVFNPSILVTTVIAVLSASSSNKFVVVSDFNCVFFVRDSDC